MPRDPRAPNLLSFLIRPDMRTLVYWQFDSARSKDAPRSFSNWFRGAAAIADPSKPSFLPKEKALANQSVPDVNLDCWPSFPIA